VHYPVRREDSPTEDLAARLASRVHSAVRGDIRRREIGACCQLRGKVGQRYDLRVKPSHDGYLMVFAVQASGVVAFCFPCEYVNDNRARIGMEIAVPGEAWLQAEPPAGQERF
jgi:hypothetical protein